MFLVHYWNAAWAWCFANGVAGNIVASLIWAPAVTVVLLAWNYFKVVVPAEKRHAEQRLHEKKIERSHQVLHYKLGTGHTLSDSIEESLEDSTPGDRRI